MWVENDKRISSFRSVPTWSEVVVLGTESLSEEEWRSIFTLCPAGRQAQNIYLWQLFFNIISHRRIPFLIISSLGNYNINSVLIGWFITLTVEDNGSLLTTVYQVLLPIFFLHNNFLLLVLYWSINSLMSWMFFLWIFF